MSEPTSGKPTKTAVRPLGPVRRVVTGHDENGRSVFVSDGTPPHFESPPSMPAINARVMWVSDRCPAVNTGDTETAPADLAPGVGPPQGGVLLRIADLPPDSEYDDVDVEALFSDIGASDERDAARSDAEGERHFWFHKTATLDYAIVLEGEIWAVLDEGETLLRAGDVLIQRGTAHAWSNRTDEMARLAFVIIDAVPDGG